MHITSLVQKISQIKEKYADAKPMINPPVGDEEIERCSRNLTGHGFPAIPQGYAEFLKICGGYAFDGVELYGTEPVTEEGSSYTLDSLCDMTFDFRKRYEDVCEVSGEGLLCFGSDVCGDYLTYNDKTGKYQHRSHEGLAHVYFECDTFEEFFDKMVYKIEIEEENEKFARSKHDMG